MGDRHQGERPRLCECVDVPSLVHVCACMSLHTPLSFPSTPFLPYPFPVPLSFNFLVLPLFPFLVPLSVPFLSLYSVLPVLSALQTPRTSPVVHVYMHVYMCVHACVCMCIYINLCVYTHTHTHMLE